MRSGLAIGIGDAGTLRLRQLTFELAALGGQVEQPLPAVSGARVLDDEPLLHELAENAAQALLGDLQDIEQLPDRHLRMAPDEMDDAVMGPPKTILREDRIGLGGEIAIGKEQQLDTLPDLVLDRKEGQRDRFYVSHIDITRNLGYRKGVFCGVACGRLVRQAKTQYVAICCGEEDAMSMIPFDDRDGFIWYDGRLVPWREAKLHVLSHGLHYASCVFEGERVYNGKVFHLEDHNERLHNSARILGFEVPASMDDLAKATEELISANNIVDGYVRPIAWRGAEQMGVSAQATKIHLALAAWDWPAYFPPEARARGIRMKWANWARPAPHTAPTEAKAAGLYMICTLSKHMAEAEGFDDALMLDWRGQLAEGTGANIFLVINGELHTPTPDCFLNGITRQTVIALARKRGIKVIERAIMPAELAKADEVFLTGSAAEVTPVGEVAGEVGNYRFTPGAICRLMSEDYDQATGKNVKAAAAA